MKNIILSEEQSNAISEISQNVFVHGGPGAGKSTLMISMVENGIKQGICPNEIMIITFSRANRIKLTEDMNKHFPLYANEVQVTTLHALCFRILKENHLYFFYGNDDQLKFIDSLEIMLSEIPQVKSLLKDNEIQELALYLHSCQAYDKEPSSEEFGHGLDFTEIWNHLQIVNQVEKCITFFCLVNMVADAFIIDPQLLSQIASRYRLIISDEVQDFAPNQLKLIEKLASGFSKLVFIGDLNQAIYSFRFTDVTFLQDMTEHYSHHSLSINYRSTQQIIDLFNAIAPHSHPMMSASGLQGPRPQLAKFKHKHQEAQWIAHKIKQLINEGYRPSDIAVLFRTNRGPVQMELPFYLAEKGIPCTQLKNQNNFIDNEIYDLFLAFVDIVVSMVPHPSFFTLLDQFVWSIYLDPLKVQKAMLPYDEIMAILPEQYEERISWLIYFINKSRESPDEISSYFLQILPSKQQKMLKKELSFLFSSLMENGPYSALQSLSTLRAEDSDKVQMNTIHMSKGLEWPIVFIPQLVDGVLPLQKATEIFEEEQEERLLYVAISRAKEQLYLSATLNTKELSPFITPKIQEQFLDII